MPEFNILPFDGGGSTPVQYDVDYEGHTYYVRYRGGWITIIRDLDSQGETEVFEQQLSSNRFDGSWSAEETTVYLALISETIRLAQFNPLRLPTKEQTKSHPFYLKGPLPLHEVGLICGQTAAANAPPTGNMNRHERKRRRLAGLHDHYIDCIKSVPACEAEEWIARHPQEHAALVALRKLR